MRFVLNTRRDDAGTRVCIYDLQAQLTSLGHVATLNDWDGYALYDVAVFMGYDHDIKRARQNNPKIKIVIADPKLASPEYIEAARQADLLLVSSVEQRDAFLRLNNNIFVYYMFPGVQPRSRRHAEGERLVVAYHGNKVHLDAMRYAVGPALVALARTREVEFLCVYNIENLGRADLAYLERAGVVVRHCQWEASSVVEVLATADIGVMPNELPVYDRQKALAQTAYPDGNFAYEPFDHLIRYKVSANPGRLYPFVCAGLPVVADFCPSSSQFIRDGDSGFLASSPHGWHFSLERLAESADLRQSCAERLMASVGAVYAAQPANFVRECEALAPREVPTIAESFCAEAEQRLFNDYPRPGETPLRWLRRQVRKVRSRW